MAEFKTYIWKGIYMCWGKMPFSPPPLPSPPVLYLPVFPKLTASFCFLTHYMTPVLPLCRVSNAPFSFPDSSVSKESACNSGDQGSILGLGRSPGEGKGYLLLYSGLENSMDCIECSLPLLSCQVLIPSQNNYFFFLFSHQMLTLSDPRTSSQGKEPTCQCG